MNEFSRTELIIGTNSMEKLKNSKVMVFGVGGVGGYVCEALARTGIGTIILVDDDNVSLTNINRQIIATHISIGINKCDVMEERIKSINPNCNVKVYKKFYLPENKDEFDFEEADYVVDCVDTVTAKISIIMRAKELNKPVISAMGAGNKMNPAMLEVSDIYKTEVDPLARVMRNEMKKRRVKKLKVVYSKEHPVRSINEYEETLNKLETRDGNSKKIIPGSSVFVPSAMGLIIASEVVKDLIDFESYRKNIEI